MGGNPPISVSPFMNMPEDNEDDRVLLGNSARQNREHFFTNSQEEIDAEVMGNTGSGEYSSRKRGET